MIVWHYGCLFYSDFLSGVSLCFRLFVGCLSIILTDAEFCGFADGQVSRFLIRTFTVYGFLSITLEEIDV